MSENCANCSVHYDSDEFFEAIAKNCYCSATRAPCSSCTSSKCPVCDEEFNSTEKVKSNIETIEDAYDRAMKGI